MTLPAQNEWQLILEKPADGTSPGSGGTTITAAGTTHTYGADTEIFAPADWGGAGNGDAYAFSIIITDHIGTPTSRAGLVTVSSAISGGAYTPIVEHLSANKAGIYDDKGGIEYFFPVRVANGSSIAAKLQSDLASATCQVWIKLYCKPTKPWLRRVGTFVRTYGAVTATSLGAPVTAGAGADGTWTEIATLADDIWGWEVAWADSDTAVGGGTLHVDVSVGDAVTKRVAIQNARWARSSNETVGKPSAFAHLAATSGEKVYVRAQRNSETGDSAIVYGVGGTYQPAGVYAVAGTVTIDGVAAADGKTVEVFAVDTDNIVERVATATTAGGAGAFTVDVPENVRSHFASYANDGRYGRSASGTPGVSTFDITIGGADGDPPTPIYGTYPTTASAMADAAGFGSSWDEGYLCNEASGNLLEAFGTGFAMAGTADAYSVPGFLAGTDKAVRLVDQSANGFVHNQVVPAGAVGATDDLVLALVIKLRATTGRRDIARYGDGGFGSGIGWSLSYEGSTSMLRFEISDGVVISAPELDLTGVLNRWLVVLVALERTSDLCRMAVTVDTGTGSLSTISDSGANVPSLGGCRDADIFGVGENGAGNGSAAFELAALYVGTGVDAAGSLATNILSAAPNLYNSIIEGTPAGYSRSRVVNQ